MDWLTSPEAWAALATLTVLEIVLGIDNIVFISILAGRLPPEQQQKGRTVGLFLALLTRIALLFSLTWVMRLTEPLFHVLHHGVSGRDLILMGGGLFLLAKSTHEIHGSLEGPADAEGASAARASFVSVVIQIGVLDIVFSLDSVITAIGLAEELAVMVTAIVLAMAVMLVAARSIGEFVEAHPTVKMLALSFLLLIGLVLLADGAHFHIPKGYVYFAMAFSFGVEMLNLRLRKATTPPVDLRGLPLTGEMGAIDGE